VLRKIEKESTILRPGSKTSENNQVPGQILCYFSDWNDIFLQKRGIRATYR
jgi:hypothetical protein